MASDTVSFSISLQHLPVNTLTVPPVNLANNALNLQGPTKYRLSQYVITAATPLVVSMSEFTTVTGLLAFNGDGTFAVSLGYKPLGGTATVQPIGAGGFMAGMINIDPTTSLTLTTAAATGTSTLTVYITGT